MQLWLKLTLYTRLVWDSQMHLTLPLPPRYWNLKTCASCLAVCLLNWLVYLVYVYYVCAPCALPGAIVGQKKALNPLQQKMVAVDINLLYKSNKCSFNC